MIQHIKKQKNKRDWTCASPIARVLNFFSQCSYFFLSVSCHLAPLNRKAAKRPSAVVHSAGSWGLKRGEPLYQLLAAADGLLAEIAAVDIPYVHSKGAQLSRLFLLFSLSLSHTRTLSVCKSLFATLFFSISGKISLLRSYSPESTEIAQREKEHKYDTERAARHLPHWPLQSADRTYWIPLGAVVEYKLWDSRKNITQASVEALDSGIAQGAITDRQLQQPLTVLHAARDVYRGADRRKRREGVTVLLEKGIAGRRRRSCRLEERRD